MLNTKIQSYSLGCLPPEEVEEFRKAAAGNPDFNLKELGKYQNLVALLPSTLPLEIPDHRVKEKVARKLYRLKGETGRMVPYNDNLPEPSHPSKDISKDIINRSATADLASERYIRKTGQVSTGNQEIKITRDHDKDRITVQSPRYRRKTKQVWLFTLGALIAGFSIAFFLFYKSDNGYVREIDKLTSEIHDLNAELVANNGLLSLLEKKDTRIFTLSGSEMYPDGYGKVFLNSTSNRGYIYLNGIPALSEDNIYQLWINNSGTFILAASFEPKKGENYLSFSYSRAEDEKNLKFLLTEEPSGGSRKPGRRIYLVSQD
jgi:hypothetical protein